MANPDINITPVTITTKRLLLRAFKQSDLDDFFEYASVEDVGNNAGWKPHTSKEETQLILTAFIIDAEVLAIVKKDTNKVIGSIGIHRSWASDEKDLANLTSKEIGYVLSKDYWGQGIATEAAQAVIEYCFTALNLEVLTCGHFIDNLRSKRVIEKCGFAFFKRASYYAKQLQKEFDTFEYLLTKENWNLPAYQQNTITIS